MTIYQCFHLGISPTWRRCRLKHTMPSALNSSNNRPRYVGAFARRPNLPLSIAQTDFILGLYYRQVIQASDRYDPQPAPPQRQRQQNMLVHAIPGTSTARSKLLPGHPQHRMSDRHINSKKKFQLRSSPCQMLILIRFWDRGQRNKET